MSIAKAQLDLLATDILDKIGEIHGPSIFEGRTMEGVLQLVAQAITNALIESAIQKDVVASHDLINNIDPTQSRTLGPGAVEVGITMPPHWRNAEEGQKPGFRPSIKAIEQWITDKSIPVRRAPHHSLKTVLQMRHQMAVAIANKIYKVGTIKRFKYKGSGFIAQIMTPQNMRLIAESIAKLYGQNIQIYLKSPTP